MPLTTARLPASPGKIDEPSGATTPRSAFQILRAGRIDYTSGLALQETLINERLRGAPDILLLVEHEPVITLGRGAGNQHVLLTEDELAHRGLSCHRVSRGGDVTWHGPGQLVAYPIVHLDALGRDLHLYLRLLEQTVITAAAAFGISAERSPGRTGVWVGERKIASIGVGVRRWVTWHGLALNVASDLAGFSTIVPCGLDGVVMTSLSEECRRTIGLNEAESALIDAFAETFSMECTGDYDFAPQRKARLA
jgi:lipoyl(octanoyl) transferase